MTYTVDVMADRMCFNSDIDLVMSCKQCVLHCYIGYDVINVVGAMTYKQWYDVIKRRCDVINSAYGVLHAVGVISYIHRV